MGKFYASLFLTFVILVIIHLVFGGINLYLWITEGIKTLLHGSTIIENVYFSIYLKWIILADVTWLLTALIFALKRKRYKTNTSLHYLNYRPMSNPIICVTIPAYNEELSIESVVKDYKNQKNVKYVIVIDNHSTDRTVQIAERCGASVIKKESNKGYAHSWVLGLKESLKTDANIIVLTDSDGTFSGSDLQKMIPYLDNCDMVIGTRLVQVLNERENQNGMFYVWGNFFLAKLLQLKYFSLLHMGIAQITDVGCSYRCIRRDSLEKIIDRFTYGSSDSVIKEADGSKIGLFTTMIAIENDLQIVEIPISFKKRIGFSKSGVDNRLKGFVYGLGFLWYILSR